MSMMQMLLGAGGKAELKVEDVFNTTTYTGNGSTGQSFVTGLDLAGEGGLVWVKDRDTTGQHHIWDTERGTSSVLRSNDPGAPWTFSNSITFNSNGHSFPGASGNENNNATVAWSFRKAEKFFDIVTYTGDGTDDRAIDHNLGCVPGMIIVKKIDGSDQYWAVYHVGAGATHYSKLNDNMAPYDHATFWSDTTPTSTQFTVGGTTSVNHNGGSHIAWLFAKDEDFIKCGSYTGVNSPGYVDLDFGWEAQWLLIKRKDSTGAWVMYDTARGMSGTADGSGNYFYSLEADTQIAEEDKTYIGPVPQSDGVHIYWGNGYHNGGSGTEYLYVAIKKPD